MATDNREATLLTLVDYSDGQRCLYLNYVVHLHHSRSRVGHRWSSLGPRKLCEHGRLAKAAAVSLVKSLMYVLKDGGRPRAFFAPPGTGLRLGYIPVIPLLLLAYAPRTPGSRILDLALAAVWVVGTAAHVEHGITTRRIVTRYIRDSRCRSLVAPSLRVFRCRPAAGIPLAQGLFTVGAYFGVTFGSLIFGRLVTNNGAAIRVSRPGGN